MVTWNNPQTFILWSLETLNDPWASEARWEILWMTSLVDWYTAMVAAELSAGSWVIYDMPEYILVMTTTGMNSA